MYEGAVVATNRRVEPLEVNREAAAFNDSDPWFLIHAQSLREKVVVEKLESNQMFREHGLRTYLPLTIQKRGAVTHSYPLFPSYVFVQIEYDLHRDVHESLSRLPLLGRVVYFGGKPAIVPTAVLVEIFRRQNSSGFVELTNAEQDFAHGDRVNVVSGLLRGFSGIFDRRLSGSDRAQILLSTINFSGNRGDWNVQSKWGGRDAEVHGCAMRVEVGTADLQLA